MDRPSVTAEDAAPLLLARTLDAVRLAGAGEVPNWAPLQVVVPRDCWAGFMWMGSLSMDSLHIEWYKHGITRRDLLLDGKGRAYRRHQAGDRWVVVPTADEVEEVLREVEGMGHARTTPYDLDFIARRNAALRRLGYDIIS